MTTATLTAIACYLCGKTIAQTDGQEIVFRHAPNVYLRMPSGATIRCHREVQVNGHWRICWHENTVVLDNKPVGYVAFT